MRKIILVFVSLLMCAGLMAQSITITYPNGGEVLSGCTSINITWNKSGVSNYYNIYYSTDNGNTYIAIATSYNTLSGSYTWAALPNLNSTNCLVKIEDALAPSTQDVSNSTFTINGSLIVLTPNGGQNWIAGTTQTINYSYNPLSVNNVKIEYSTDNGSTWITIISSTPATGSYSWTIPNTPTNLARVKISDVADPGCRWDKSDTTFIISSSVTVTLPNGGETWQAYVGAQGTSINMSNAPLMLNTGYYYDNGGPSGNFTATSYTQTLTPDNPLNKLTITINNYSLSTSTLRIYDGPNTGYTLVTTLTGTGSYTFTATNYTGALTFLFTPSGISSGWNAYIQSVGTPTKNITWNIVGTSKYFNIDYSTNSGSTWTNIATNYYTTSGIFAWQVPNTPSTNCRVRVMDNQNNVIVDQSDADFTITAAQPVFIVTVPNGGEAYYPTTTQTITWQSAFVSPNVAIDYSTNNGSTWNVITASYPNNNGGLVPNQGTYSWTVPNTPSTQALVKVKDASNFSYNDVSNSVFTILPHITVNYPNGGNVITGCAPITVTWTAGGTSGNYTIEYTTDNGVTWLPIGTTTSTSISWSVPYFTSTQCKVRVTDTNDPLKTDMSDNVFTVNPPDIHVTVLTPNGGENWIAGTTQNITYTYALGVNNISLEYSTNNGTSWTTITGNTTTTGSYSWTVPNTPSNQCLIRITNLTHAGCYSYSDVSNATFTILSSVTVTVPNGGETWQAYVGTQGTSINMSNAPLMINTGYYYDNGGPSGNFTATSYTQTLTPDNPLNKLTITINNYSLSTSTLRIYDGPNTGYTLVTTLTGTGSYTFTATNYTGALTFLFTPSGISSGWNAYIQSVGTPTQNITWNIVGTSKYFNIDYSTNSGSTWTNIATNYYTTSGIYPWQVPNTPSTNCRVRVMDNQNNVIVDQSNADFTITAAQPVFIVTVPNGGEAYYPTTTQTITWQSAFVSPNVAIDYSTNNGSTWNVITASYPNNSGGLVPNQGTYSWTVPNTPSTQALVKVKDAGNFSYNDVSNSVFTILPHITVNYPNGGNVITGCAPITVTWTAGGTSGNYTVEYTTDNGITWLPIGTTTSTSISWSVPYFTSAQCKVRVTDTNDPLKTDMSDNVFTVNPPDIHVTVLTPNGGENWIAGTTQNITYTYALGVNNISIEYSTNNGTSWTTITGNTTTTGSYSWVVPNTPSTQCLIRITNLTHAGCYSYSDVSNATFTILSSVTVTVPNGGETWQAYVGTQGTTINMSNAPLMLNTGYYYDNGGPSGNFTATSYTQTLTPDNPLNKLTITINNYSLSTSTLRIYDGPNTGYTLVTTLTGTGSYTYTATNYTGALTFLFTPSGISSGWNAYIQSVGTPTKNITWNIVGTSKYFNIDYSTNSGSTWTNIATNYYTTSGIFAWQVPNTPSTNCRVRIMDNQNNVIVDQSDADFTITAAQPVFIVTVPNGGEAYYPTTTQTITWQSAFVSPTVAIDYSTNNGSTWNVITTGYPNNNGGLVPNQGTYSWTVPNTPSTQALVKVKDASNFSYNDVSNSVFTILPHITVNYPNGGNVITGCAPITVTWTAGGTSGNYTIEYTTDNGVTWLPIGTTTSTSISWSVPYFTSTQCKVRVTDTNDPLKTDMSDNVFTVNPPDIHVTILTPNGGENWIAGTTQTITYTYATGVNNISLEYSTNNGTSWTTITGNTTTTGSYSWTVPNTPSTQCLIRITNLTHAGCYSYSDVSNATFTILSSVTVTVPNGGETWQAYVGAQGTSINMSNAPLMLNTGYYYDNGGPSGNFTATSYTQTLTPDNPLNKLTITINNYSLSTSTLRIYDGPNTGYTLVTTLTGSGSYTYTATNYTGALTFLFTPSGISSGWNAYIQSVGTPTKNITWNIIGTSKYFNIDYSTNSGSTWTNIATNYYTTSGIFAWQVPNTPSTNCRVRIMDNQNNVIVDQSDADFTITAAQPVFIVTVPNGGEAYYPTTTQTITWQSAFVSPNVAIDYSTNNGSTWNVITASYPNNNGGLVPNQGTYSWTVPNTPSTQALVKVKDASNFSYNDVSNSVFTILPHITVNYPNGGNVITGCAPITVTWTAGGTSGNYTIEYTTDNGVTWLPIGTTTSTSISWSVPYFTSTQCKVRVTDTNDPLKTDMSDNVFTVNPPDIHVTVLTPNGGENWIAGTTQNITYTYALGVNNISLEYSTNNGTSWTTITGNTTTTGSYSWVVPNTPSTQCLIRITNLTHAGCYSYSDVSNATFTILSSVTVTVPNGGETWQAYVGTQGTTINMSNAPLMLNTGYYYDNGGPSGNFTATSYTQTLTPDNPLNKLTITFYNFSLSTSTLRIYDGPNTGYTLVMTLSGTGSSYTYTATNYTGSLTFLFTPSGISSGWNAYIQSVGTPTQNITWSIVGTSKYFNLDYSTDGGSSWTNIATNYYTTSGIYPWQVPNTPSNTCRVRVTDYQNNVIVDQSNANFTITAAQPVFIVTIPNGGEAYYPTTTQTITWQSAFVGPTVAIDYSTNNGSTWNVITTGYPNNNGGLVPNQGTYSWTVPNTPTTQALVKVKDASNFSYNDVSNSVFTILPHITVNYPNGGNVITGCAPITVTWTAGGTSGNYTIEYTTDNGVTWLPIGTTTSTSISWSVPYFTSTQCKVRVTDTNDPLKTDMSDNVFTVNPPDIHVTILTPNGGENWIAGTTQTITYTYATGVNNISLEYSTNNGTSWTTITGNTTTTGSYSWVVPNTPSTQCLIRITNLTHAGCYSYSDVSNATFTILSSVTVTVPNGGEIWQAYVGAQGTSINMSNAPLMLNTGYYYDNGGPSGNFTATSYTQTLTPDNPLNKLSITIYNYSLSTSSLKIYDGPNTGYTLVTTLTGTGSYTYTATNSTGSLTFLFTPSGISSGWNAYIQSVGTPTKNIMWNIVGTSKYFNIDYSTNSGSTWTNIATNYYTTSGIYAWQIPNTPSTKCRVRIMDYQNNVIVDQSDADFTITAAQPFITVTSPNGGEIYYQQQVKQITWISPTFLTANVNIEYSLNDGVTWMSIASNILNSGSYSWTVPLEYTSYPSSRVRVTDAANPAVKDISDNTFTIKPAIELISPNNNIGFWGACTQSSITWNAGISNSYKIEYSSDNGVTWVVDNANYSNSNAYVVYTWNVPGTPSDKYLVRVTDNNNINYFDVSQSNFTVSPAITLNYPTNGDVLQAGSVVQITWTSYNTTNYYKIDYSVNNGASWINIVNNYYNITGSYSWTVPNNPSNSCLVRISDYNAPCKTDASDHVFSISTDPAYVLLTNMNIGTISGCSVQNINFTSSGVSYVNIDYSMNGGSSWSSIVSNLNISPGTYAWTVPNDSTNKLLIRITDAGNPLHYDVSNNFLTISQPVHAFITITGTTTICAGDTVQLTSNHLTGNLWSTGSTTQSIFVTTAGTYTLTVTQGACVAVSDPVVVTVNPSPVAPSITITGSTNLCVGDQVILTSSYTSQNVWYPNGETTQSIVITTAGYYAVSISNQYGCSTSSQFVTVTVTPQTTPSVSISTPLTTVCTGANVVFTATPTYGGTSPVYQWKKNGTNTGTNSSTYSDNTIQNNDVISVQMTSNANCLTTPTVTSNSILMTVNPNSTPSVSISTPLTSICNGVNATFTANALNSGTSPAYQWKVNGVNAGTNSNIYTTNSLANNSVVTCVVTSNAPCNTVNPVTSNAITMTVLALPAAPVATSNSPVPLNGTLNLYASTISGATYSWTGPNGYTSNLQNPAIANATPTLNGTYYVTAIVNGCNSPVASTVVVVNPSQGTVTVSGYVRSEIGQGVNGAKVKLTGASTDSTTTPVNGSYQFSVTQGSNYVITPSKNNDIIGYNGITTLDIVLMQRHILNVQLLSSPYKIIAADVNGSGTVTTLDIVLTKALILQNITTFPGNRLWTFVNSDYVFSNPNNPFPYESSRSYSNISGVIDQNFVAVKLGDVNNSWDPSIAKSLSPVTVGFEAGSANGANGDLINIPVRVNNFNKISGFQYTISWNPAILDFVTISNAALDMDYGILQTANGSLTALYATELLNGITLPDGSAIFNIQFRIVGHNGDVSPISFNSTITMQEACNNDLDILTMVTNDGLVKVGDATGIVDHNTAGYELLQNIPNPFSGNTDIIFTLPAASNATIIIFDIFGKKVAEIKGDYQAGRNTVIWDGRDTDGQKLSDGTYYYRLQTGNYSAIRKMVLIK